MGRKKRPGFADVHASRAAFDATSVPCPTCKQPVGAGSGPRFVATFGNAPPALATLTCERCRTMLSIRFVEAT